MLPPVSAVSAADVSFQTAGSRQDNTPPPVAALPILQVEQETANAGASATVRAVSGELRLSQNVGVLAETLGKLLNIARMDDEAADTYVDRLITTMQSLPADQKAALEKQLGSILRGISLSVLADVLKNSAGPEAARLAVMFELARSSSATRGTKTPLSSYLQDLLPPSPAALPVPARNVPVASAMNEITQYDGAKAALRMDGTENQPLAKQPPLPAAENNDQASPKPLVNTLPSNIGGPIKVLSQLPAQEQISRLPNTTMLPLITGAPLQTSGDTRPLDPPANQPLFAHNQRGGAVQEIQELENAITASPIPSTGFPQMDQSGSLPATGNPFAGATAKEMEALLRAVLLGRVPDQAGATVPTPAPQALLDAVPDHAAKPQTAVPTAPHIKPADETLDETALSTIRPEFAAAQKAAMAGDVKAAILEQPGLHSAVAAMIAKEGIPLPFVNYPAEQQEPESDAPPRGRWPSSEGDSEGQEDGGEQSEQGSEHEERTAANDEIIDHSVSEGANDDGAAGNAESYYLRMSGMS